MFYLLFMLSGLFLSFGLILQSKAILTKAVANSSQTWQRIFALFFKLLGFALPGYLIIYRHPQQLWQNLLIFLASFLISFLLYLLAKKI